MIRDQYETLITALACLAVGMVLGWPVERIKVLRTPRRVE